jgi:hypothetical protein
VACCGVVYVVVCVCCCYGCCDVVVYRLCCDVYVLCGVFCGYWRWQLFVVGIMCVSFFVSFVVVVFVCECDVGLLCMCVVAMCYL